MSVNINHQTNNVQVGSALTLGHTQGLQYHTQSLHTDGFEVNNINASGIGTFGSLKVSSGNSIKFAGPTTTGSFYHANNSDTTLLRVTSSGSTANLSGDYGFTLKYLGSGTGNNNKLQILSDNQNAGTQVQAFTMLQDGKLGIASNAPSTELDVGGTLTADVIVPGEIRSDSFYIKDASASKTKMFFAGSGSGHVVRLYADGSEKLSTTSTGIYVQGNGKFTGIATAASARLGGSFPSAALTIIDDYGLNVDGGIATATGFSTSGGTSSQFLKADGSVDSSTYLTSYTETQTLNDVLGLGNTSSTGLSVGVVTATSFVKSGGTSSQYLMADGSVTTGGGGSSNSFETIAVSGQSDVVADSATDTLTLVAGSNMTITTNASGDSVTFASSGGGGGGGVSQEESIAFAIALG